LPLPVHSRNLAGHRGAGPAETPMTMLPLRTRSLLAPGVLAASLLALPAFA